MSLIGWLGDFLEKRNCVDRKPDGRPLYAYRCKLEEFKELQTLLGGAEKIVPGRSLHLGYAFATEYLFTLYCAEWWRRYHIGGVWKWEPIKQSLGWKFCDWHTSTDFVRKGLRYWQRDLLTTGAGTQYLFSVLCEGGIPINVLERDGVAFKGYLRTVIREYGYYALSGLGSKQIAEDNLNRLPASWRQPQIAILAGQIVEKVWYFKTQIGEVQDVINALNKIHPEWADQLPLDLERDQAELLIKSLIEVARESAAGSSRILKIERFLTRALNDWRLEARILIPKDISFNQITELTGAATELLPERLEMYRLAAGSRVLIAKLSKLNDGYSVRPTLEATRVFSIDVAAEQEVILVNRGNRLASLPVTGGTGLDESLPWCFVLLDQSSKSFRWIAQGSCKRREPSVFVLSSFKPEPMFDSEIALDPLVEEQVLGRNLWQVDRVSIVQDEERESYRVEPGLQQIAARDYRLIGHRRYFPTTRFPLFNAVPQIQWVEDVAVGFVPREELVWRYIGTLPWNGAAGKPVLGDVEVRHRKDGAVVAAWRLSVLPEKLKIELEPVNRREGKIHIRGDMDGTVCLVNQPSLEIWKDEGDGECTFNCTRSDTSLTEIGGRIRGKDGAELAFSLPFPAEGAAFCDSKGIELDQSYELAQSRLYGVRAQSMTLDSRKKYQLRASISSLTSLVPATKHHWFEYDMLVDESGLSTLPLQQINNEIARLFAIGTEADDKVKLELIENSNSKPAAVVHVKQFEGSMSVDLTGRLITLFLDKHLLPEYVNSSLQLISVNDFATDPIELSWNDVRCGWSLPDYADMDASHTFFATVMGSQSQLIRPCVVPAEGTPSLVGLSDLQRALLIRDFKERRSAIDNVFTELEATRNRELCLELCVALRRFSSVHPDGLDLVACLVDRPKLMALIWFYAVGDGELKGYLRRITETSPFDWWMAPIDDWLAAAATWSKNELAEIGNTEVSDMLVQRVKSELVHFVNEQEELNAVGDLLLEFFGAVLSIQSIMSTARKTPINTIWGLLDQLGRGNFINQIGESSWPIINEVFALQKMLPEDLFRLIDWPVNDLGHQKSVMQAPIVAAAAMHAGVEISANHKIALMAARNFHPAAFATNFRATQAALWPLSELKEND